MIKWGMGSGANAQNFDLKSGILHILIIPKNSNNLLTTWVSRSRFAHVRGQHQFEPVSQNSCSPVQFFGHLLFFTHGDGSVPGRKRT